MGLSKICKGPKRSKRSKKVQKGQKGPKGPKRSKKVPKRSQKGPKKVLKRSLKVPKRSKRSQKGPRIWTTVQLHQVRSENICWLTVTTAMKAYDVIFKSSSLRGCYSLLSYIIDWTLEKLMQQAWQPPGLDARQGGGKIGFQRAPFTL